MNRKKIIICLNGHEQGHYEKAFIHDHLANPHHLILEFKLDSLVVNDFEENLLLKSTENVLIPSDGDLVRNTLQKTRKHESVTKKQKSNKKQVIYSSSIKDLIIESQYADLLIIRNANFYADCPYYGQVKPMYELLKRTGCPVVLIPDQPFQIQQIAIIYDGNPSSLAAIKSLRTVMAPLCYTLPVTVFIPCHQEATLISSHEEKIFIEYLRLHFKDLGIHKISENSVHTMHCALDSHKIILFVHNNIEQILPAFIETEMEKLKLNQSHFYFSFFANNLTKG